MSNFLTSYHTQSPFTGNIQPVRLSPTDIGIMCTHCGKPLQWLLLKLSNKLWRCHSDVCLQRSLYLWPSNCCILLWHLLHTEKPLHCITRIIVKTNFKKSSRWEVSHDFDTNKTRFVSLIYVLLYSCINMYYYRPSSHWRAAWFMDIVVLWKRRHDKVLCCWTVSK